MEATTTQDSRLENIHRGEIIIHPISGLRRLVVDRDVKAGTITLKGGEVLSGVVYGKLEIVIAR